MKRLMSVSGAFYPDKAQDIIDSFSYFCNVAKEHCSDAFYEYDVKALIVPHAGYVYSGFSANLAYLNVKKTPKRVVLIGPSHRVAFSGVSMSYFEAYETPLDDIKADKEYMLKLSQKFDINSIQEANAEHSTEVQFPFIKHYFKDAKLVELVYGQSPNLIPIIEDIVTQEDTLLLISTDLSHFHSQEEANSLDKSCIEAVESLDTSKLEEGEACGKEGVKALINVVKKLGLKTQSIDYRTSGDISGDMDRVVGYYSAMVY